MYFNSVTSFIKYYSKSLRCYLVLILLFTSQVAHAQFTKLDKDIFGIQGGESTWIDYDNDNDLDLFISGIRPDSTLIVRPDSINYYEYFPSLHTSLYKNDQNASFIKVWFSQTPYGGTFQWGDLDQDDDLDLILLWSEPDNEYDTQTTVYLNDGIGGLHKSNSISFDISNLTLTSQNSIIDFDNDGDKDFIYISRLKHSSKSDKVLYENLGDLNFKKKELNTIGTLGQRTSWGDFDLDGDLDFKTLTITSSGVFINKNASNFDELDGITFEGYNNGSNSWIDYNNDQYLDLFLQRSTHTSTNIYLYQNTSNGFDLAISNNLEKRLVEPPIWGDLNNDGKSDLILTGSSLSILEHKGDEFTPMYDNSEVFDLIKPGNQAVGDFDNDGDLDLVLSSSPHQVHIFKNDISTKNNPPEPPTNLVIELRNHGYTFSWNASTDNETPSKGLSYELYLTNKTTGDKIITVAADKETGYRRLAKRGMIQTTFWPLKRTLPDGEYIWGVQAIDVGFMGSEFALGSFCIVDGVLGNCRDEIKLGQYTFKADQIVQTSESTYQLAGNVRTTNGLYFSDKLTIKTDENKISGAGEVYLKSIDNYEGNFPINKGDFEYEILEKKITNLAVNTNALLTNANLFLSGIPFYLGNLELTENGFSFGFVFKLPKIEQVNLDVSIIDNALQSASVAIEKFSIFDKILLKEGSVAYNFGNKCFEVGTSLEIEGPGIKLLDEISGKLIIKDGEFDTISLAIESSNSVLPFPPFPLLSIAGLNGSLSNLTNPPPTLALGMDLVPIVPNKIGDTELIRFNDLSASYTFGKEFSLSGGLELFEREMANASLTIGGNYINLQGNVSLGFDIKNLKLLGKELGDVSVNNIISGHLSVEVKSEDDVINFRGSMGGGINLPDIECSLCEPLKGISDNISEDGETSLFGAEIEISKQGSIFAARSTLEVFFVDINFELLNQDGETEIEIGGNFDLIPEVFFQSGSASPFNFQNDLIANRTDKLSGKSLLYNQAGEASEEVEPVRFELKNSLGSAVIKVAGDEVLPIYQIQLPNGEKVDKANVNQYENITYFESDRTNETFFFLKLPSPGIWEIQFETSTETLKIDFMGAAYAPSIVIDSLEQHQELTTIYWTDTDYDSDATVAFFYSQNIDGSQPKYIVSGISENDNADQYVWNTSSLTPGGYYLFASIEDSTYAPQIWHYPSLLNIGGSATLTPPKNLLASNQDSVIGLSWTKSTGATAYNLYYSNQDTVTFNSDSFQLTDTASVTFAPISGRNYTFMITAVDSEGAESVPSNISQVDFVSTSNNNAPYFVTSAYEQRLVAGIEHEVGIVAVDRDNDALTYQLISSPNGLKLNENTLSWTPTVDQTGRHLVTIQVTDSQGGTDEQQLELEVLVDQTGQIAKLSTGADRVVGYLNSLFLKLEDADLNSRFDTRQQASLKVTSSSDPVGFAITLTEEGLDADQFTASLQFGTETDALEHSIKVNYGDTINLYYQDDWPDTNITEQVLFESPYLSVEADQLELSKNESTVEVEVTSNTPWQLNKTENWISFDESEGFRDGVGIIQIDANNDYQVRETLITFTNQHGLVDTLIIKQDRQNRAPTAIDISNDLVVENSGQGSYVGKLSSIDPDSDEAFTYQLSETDQFELKTDSIFILVSPDFELQNLYEINITTTDSRGSTYSETINIQIENVNEAPDAISLSSASIAENSPEVTFIGLIEATDPDQNDELTISLINNTDFSIANDSLFANVSFDHESQDQINLEIKVVDTEQLELIKMLTILVTNVNEAPNSISLSNASIPENSTQGTLVGLIDVSDPDNNDEITLSLVENTNFSLARDSLFANTSFNHESQMEVNLEIKAVDAGQLELNKSFTITINNVNEVPESLSLDHSGLVENLPIGTFIGLLSSSDPDADELLTFEVKEGDLFSVRFDSLFSNVSFNFEENDTEEVKLRVTDSGNLSLEKVLTIEIIDDNERPRDLLLSNQSVLENQSNNTFIGTLSTVDEDISDLHVYTITDGQSFNIIKDSLFAMQSFDFEEQATFEVEISTTDVEGLSFTKSFTINVFDEEEIVTSLYSEVNTFDLSIFPNPTSKKLLISWPSQASQEISLAIINTNGTTLQESHWLHSPFSIDVSGNPAGLYLLKISMRNGRSITRKVIFR